MNLKIENARGQCKDAAGVMVGAKPNVVSRIKALNTKCLYTYILLWPCLKDAYNKLSCLKNLMDIHLKRKTIRNN